MKEFSVAGINMENRHLLIREILAGDPNQKVVIEVIPEPDNKFDPNAQAVYMNKKKIGYIPKAKTHELPKRGTGYYAVCLDIGFGGDDEYAYCLIGINPADDRFYIP